MNEVIQVLDEYTDRECLNNPKSNAPLVAATVKLLLKGLCG